MRLVRPVFHSLIRAERRLEAQRGARGVTGEAVVKQVGGSSLSIPRREGEPALGPCLSKVPKSGPLQAYAKLVLKGKIREDEHQVKALHLLQKVRTRGSASLLAVGKRSLLACRSGIRQDNLGAAIFYFRRNPV